MFKINYWVVLLTLAAATYPQLTYAGCDPCVCGMGGGQPRPPSCNGMPNPGDSQQSDWSCLDACREAGDTVKTCVSRCDAILQSGQGDSPATNGGDFVAE